MTIDWHCGEIQDRYLFAAAPTASEQKCKNGTGGSFTIVPTMTANKDAIEYDDLHPFRKYLRLLKQLPDFDYMQAKRIAETGMPRRRIADLLQKSGVYIVVNADQQQIDAVKSQFINARHWNTICQFSHYNHSEWSGYMGPLMQQQHLPQPLRVPVAMHDGFVHSPDNLLFLSDQCDLRVPVSTPNIFYSIANDFLQSVVALLHRCSINMVWFLNPTLHPTESRFVDKRLLFLPKECAEQVNAFMDCGFDDLIKATTWHRGVADSCVVAKNLQPVDPIPLPTPVDVRTALYDLLTKGRERSQANLESQPQ